MKASNTTRLRLGPLPKTDTVKITVTLPAALKTALERYAAAHTKAYGEPVEAVSLIPYMLEAFMDRDRAFKKAMRDHTSLDSTV